MDASEKRGVERGREEGLKEGLKEGLEKTLQNARNALAKGYSPEQIRDITGLDMETIERLRN